MPVQDIGSDGADGYFSDGTSACEVRLLGPVQVVRSGRDIPLGGPRPRAVLALLALEAGRVVPAGRLVEEVWRGSPAQEELIKVTQATCGTLRSSDWAHGQEAA